MSEINAVPATTTPDESALLAKGEELAAAEREAEAAIYEEAQKSQAEEQALLPEKFRGKSAAEIAKAYTELEKKLGAPKEPTEAPEGDEEPEATDAPESDEDAPEEPTEAAELLRTASEEWADGGEMSEETIAKLSALPSAELVKAYAESQRAAAADAGAARISDAEALAVVDAVGGKAVYDKALAWAGEAFSPEEANNYDAVIATGNKAAIAFAVEALTQRYKAAEGFEGDTISGGRTRAPGVNPFRSNAELATAIRDRRYHDDPAYRMDVEARLAVSGDLL